MTWYINKWSTSKTGDGMTIYFGSWIVPAMITIVSFALAFAENKGAQIFGNPDFSSGMILTVRYLVALVISQFAWIIYLMYN